MGRGEPPILRLVRPARAERPQRLPHVRPPHGAARAVAGSVMRRLTLVVLCLAAVGVSACGGDDELVSDRPSTIPDLTIPDAPAAEASGDDAASTTSTDEDDTSTTSTDADGASGASGDTGGAASGTPSGGAATPAPAPTPQQGTGGAGADAEAP